MSSRMNNINEKSTSAKKTSNDMKDIFTGLASGSMDKKSQENAQTIAKIIAMFA